MILVITLSSLRINAIYFNVIASHKLLVAGVLVALLVLTGSGDGAFFDFFWSSERISGAYGKLCLPEKIKKARLF